MPITCSEIKLLMITEIHNILKKNNLSVTENRVSILSLFLKSRLPLTHAQIEQMSTNKLDRVSIYRTLQVFVEKGILHHIPTANDSIVYALCQDECSTHHQHVDDHVHFFCNTCLKYYCIEQVQIPTIQLPNGYLAHEKQVVIQGICKQCNQAA